jgi:hypothetical protein
MIQLLATVLSVAGSAGFASFLKIAGTGIHGFFEARHDHKMAQMHHMATSDTAYQTQFKSSEDGGMSTSAANTRRLMACMLSGMIVFIGCYSILHPDKELTTFILPEVKKSFGLLWGFITIPSSKEVTVVVTLGHLSIMCLNLAAMVISFYFTPGGRR